MLVWLKDIVDIVTIMIISMKEIWIIVQNHSSVSDVCKEQPGLSG